MNSCVKKLLDICCIAAILLGIVILLSHDRPRTEECQIGKNSMVEIKDHSETNRDLERNVIYDVEKQEIVRIRNENKHVAIKETHETQEKSGSIEKASKNAQEIELTSRDKQIYVRFEDGVEIDCSFLKGINKTEMFGDHESLPYMEYIDDNTEKRTFFTCDNCSRFNYATQIEPTRYIKNMIQDKPVIVLMIASRHGRDAAKYRNIIRQTWGSVVEYEGVTVHRIFLFGECPSKRSCDIIYKEQQRYGDILMSEFEDTYRNLTQKTLLGLEWFGRHYGENAFFIKVDTDVIIDIFKIIRFINSYESYYKWTETDFIFGHINERGKVRRYGDDDWVVSRDIYPNRSFPPYALGPAYGMHYNVAKTILDAYPYIPIVPLEDAYMGIAAAYSGSIQPMYIEHFLEEYYLRENCAYVSSYFVHHKVSSEQIQHLWNSCVCVLI